MIIRLLKNIRVKYLAAILSFTCIVVNGQSWNLVWSDEFDSTVISTSNWTFEYGNSGWGNNELEYYTGREENAKVANGNLMIIAKKESYGGSSYTSARMKSQGLQSFTYGKIEASIKLPSGKGLWPAFWMLGDNITFVGWPKCGEIDIMEHINNNTSVNGTLHWDNNGHVSSGGAYSGINVGRFHTYSVEWSPQVINFFVDGSKYWNVSINNNINNTGAFQLPFFILLNLAVGGNWPGSPDNTTTFPDTMFVDYVRVYQLATDVEGNNTKELPAKFSLYQNYPNPFNPSTVIKFSVPSFEKQNTIPVRLRVYDSLGQEVATLVDEEKAPGNYEVKFPAGDGMNNGLTSGVYFYTLSTNGFFQTKKMLLMK
jgi:beta-glucanase (GH16 family)